MIKCFTARKKLRNCATTICHYAVFSQTVRLKKTMTNEHSFVSSQHRTLQMKTYIGFIVASDTKVP
jgi:hypothetical protein